MKTLALATYWLMVVAVVGGIHSQHSGYAVEDRQAASPELAFDSSEEPCRTTHRYNGRIGVADAECVYTLRILQ